MLPGVGAFGDGMAGLRQRGLEAVLQQIASLGKPLLGICLGMQLLFESSDEMGQYSGLGLLPGQGYPLSEIWLEGAADRLEPAQYRAATRPCWQGCPAVTMPTLTIATTANPPKPQDNLASTDYILSFSSVVGRGHLYGVQFHPEKSQDLGLQILRNFVERCL